MTTNNHPAHGPVSLDRLHQIREILSKAAAQSDGGNLGYAMADAVKVIDGVIAVFDANPVGTFRKGPCGYYPSFHEDAVPLYAAPQPVPVVPDEKRDDDGSVTSDFDHGWNACRAAMLQAGNSPATPDCWCRTCRPVTMSDMRFVVCPDCGNKRCPHANDHRNACTGSNEPGQVGSAYPAAPQQENV